MADLDDIVLITVAPLGAPGTGITNTQYTSLDSDRTALLARANITKLDDVPDVNAPAPSDGNALVYQASSSTWIPAANLEALAAVKVNNATILANTQKVNFSSAFSGAVNGTDGTQVDVSPVFGTTAGTFRAGNQAANPGIVNRWTFAATGLLSSGTRTVITQTTSNLINGVTYDYEAFFDVTGRNNVNNGSVTLTITVNGTSLTRTQTTVGGVPHEMNVTASGNGLVGTGAGITVSGAVAYNAGDATNVDDGWFKFSAWPRL